MASTRTSHFTIMKILLLIGLLTASSLALADDAFDQFSGKVYDEACSQRQAGFEKADREYRAAIAATFQYADRIDVFLLDFDWGLGNYRVNEEEPVFRISNDGPRETQIFKQTTVPTTDIPQWCAATTKLLVSQRFDGVAFCHLPIHGIRIWARGHVLSQTSLCWHCQTYYFAYPDVTQSLAISKDGADLEKLCSEVMPVPSHEEMQKMQEAREARLKAKDAREVKEAEEKEARETKEAKEKEAREAHDAKGRR